MTKFTNCFSPFWLFWICFRTLKTFQHQQKSDGVAFCYTFSYTLLVIWCAGSSEQNYFRLMMFEQHLFWTWLLVKLTLYITVASVELFSTPEPLRGLFVPRWNVSRSPEEVKVLKVPDRDEEWEPSLVCNPSLETISAFGSLRFSFYKGNEWDDVVTQSLVSIFYLF